MKHIRFDPQTITVKVGTGDPRGRGVIPVIEPFKTDFDRDPLINVIYWEILYPAVEARDRREGKNVSHSLVPPDPWLVALGLVMWEGIIQGMSWDVVKASVRAAMQTMQADKVAPSTDYIEDVTTSTNLGFGWTEYMDGKKQYDMFVGLKRVHKKKTQRKSSSES